MVPIGCRRRSQVPGLAVSSTSVSRRARSAEKSAASCRAVLRINLGTVGTPAGHASGRYSATHLRTVRCKRLAAMLTVLSPVEHQKRVVQMADHLVRRHPSPAADALRPDLLQPPQDLSLVALSRERFHWHSTPAFAACITRREAHLQGHGDRGPQPRPVPRRFKGRAGARRRRRGTRPAPAGRPASACASSAWKRGSSRSASNAPARSRASARRSSPSRPPARDGRAPAACSPTSQRQPAFLEDRLRDRPGS